MLMATLDGQSNTLTRSIRTSRPTSMMSQLQLIHVLLTGMTYLALFRSTGMGYGYPVYQAQLGQVDYGLVSALNYCLAALGLAYIALDAQFLIRSALKVPTIIVGIFFLVVTVGGSEEVQDSAKGFITVFFISLPVVAFAARYGAERTHDLLRRFCIAAIFLNLLYIAAFPQFAIMGGGQGLRGMFVHKNAFGPFMAIACIIVFSNWRRVSVSTFFAVAAFVVALGFVAASRSASAVLMLMAAAFYYVGLRLILFVKGKTARTIIVVGFVSCGLAAVAIVYLYLFDDLLNLMGRDATLTGRTKFWSILIDVTSERPYIGHGFGVFSVPAAFLRYQEGFADAFGWGASSTHNSYLEALLNIGYVFSAYWAFILARIAWKNVATYRGVLQTYIVKQQLVIIMILISACTESAQFFSPTFFWLALIVSLFRSKSHGGGNANIRRRYDAFIPRGLPARGL